MENELNGTIVSHNMEADLVVTSLVRDNSQREETKELTAAGYGAIQPFFGSKGPGNEIVKIKSNDLSTFENLFDKNAINDISTYGYGGIIIEQVLKGGGDVHACRLTAEDAKSATFVLSIGVEEKINLPVYERISDDEEDRFKFDENDQKIPKVDESGTPVVTSGVVLTTLVEEYNGVVANAQNGNWDGTFQRSGNNNIKYYPILMGEIKYTGSYGKNYSISFELDTERDAETEDGRRFAINFHESVSKENGVSTLRNINPDKDGDPFTFSFNPDAVFLPNSNVSENFLTLYKSEIVDADPNFPVKLVVNQKMVKDLSKLLYEKYTVDGNIYDVDFISGLNTKQKPYKSIQIADSEIRPLFFSFHGGHGGSLEVGTEVPNPNGGTVTVTQDMVENTKIELLKQFYEHELITNTIDSRIIPAAVSFDANWPIEIKKVMVNDFLKYRHDMTVYIDGGIEKTRDNSLAIIKTIKDVTNDKHGHRVRFIPHAGVAKDRDILLEVPGTYEVARGKMALFMERRLFTSYGGTSKGRIRYMVPYWVSKTDKDGSDVGELKELACKYIKQYGEDPEDICFFSDYTAFGTTSSKLKNENNSDIICDGIRIAEAIMIHYIFDDRETAIMQSEAIDQFNKIVGTRYGSNVDIEIQFSQSKRDLNRNKYRVFIYYRFPEIPQGFIVELIVDNKNS